MKTFKYKTYKGTAVELIIHNSKNIEIKANGKTLHSNGFIVYDKSINPPAPALSTDLKINGKVVNVGITDKILQELKELREEEKIAELPYKEQLQEKMKRLKEEASFTSFIDADLVTGQRWYVLKRKVDKDVWKQIAHLFSYINTRYHSDDFDSMFESGYKGYATVNPDKVENILRKIFKDEIDIIEYKIAEFEKELEEYEKKIRKEKELQKTNKNSFSLKL